MKKMISAIAALVLSSVFLCTTAVYAAPVKVGSVDALRTAITAGQSEIQLTQDMIFTGSAINGGNGQITVDGAGHTITGQQTANATASYSFGKAGSTIAFKNMTFDGNNVEKNAGIYVADGAKLILEDVNIRNFNTKTAFRGVVSVETNGEATLKNVKFGTSKTMSGNQAGNYGVYVVKPESTLNIDGNTAGDAPENPCAYIYMAAGTLNIKAGFTGSIAVRPTAYTAGTVVANAEPGVSGTVSVVDLPQTMDLVLENGQYVMKEKQAAKATVTGAASAEANPEIPGDTDFTGAAVTVIPGTETVTGLEMNFNGTKVSGVFQSALSGDAEIRTAFYVKNLYIDGLTAENTAAAPVVK